MKYFQVINQPVSYIQFLVKMREKTSRSPPIVKITPVRWHCYFAKLRLPTEFLIGAVKLQLSTTRQMCHSTCCPCGKMRKLANSVNDKLLATIPLSKKHSCLSEFNMSRALNSEKKGAIFTLVLEKIHWSWCQLALEKLDISGVGSHFFSNFLSWKKWLFTCWVICCSHWSDRRIRVCLTPTRLPHQGIYLAQSHYSTWISCRNHSVWILFLVHDVMESGGHAQRMTLTRKFGLIWCVMICGFRKNPVDWGLVYRYIKGLQSTCFINFKFKGVLSASFLTFARAKQLTSVTYMKTTLKHSCAWIVLYCIPSIRVHR